MANNGFIRQMCTHIKKLRYKKLKGKQVEVLKRHPHKLRTVSLNKKRQLLSQRSGFLPVIAPLLMSVAKPIIEGISSVFKG